MHEATELTASHAALMDETDEKFSFWTEWYKVPVALGQKFRLDACDASSLAAIGSDVNSSSESLIHGLDDVGGGRRRRQSRRRRKAASISVVANVTSRNARVRFNSRGAAETSGSMTLALTVNFKVSMSLNYEKTWKALVYHHGIVAVYINVGFSLGLEMTGHVGFQISVPIKWNFCVSVPHIVSTGTCSGSTNSVSSKGISFDRWIGIEVSGFAEVSASIQLEKAGLITTSAQVVSKMTLLNTVCTVRYDSHIKMNALTTLVELANLAGKVISLGTGTCFDEFGEPELAAFLSKKIWEGPCWADKW